LEHPLEGQRDPLLVAARYAVREDMHVIALLEKVLGGLDVHKDERPEIVLVKRGENPRRRH